MVLTKDLATKIFVGSERFISDHFICCIPTVAHNFQVAKLFADAASICITAFISPYREDREGVRDLHKKSNLDFIEVFVDAPLEVVQSRDPKGLYKKARAGEIKGTHHTQFSRINDKCVVFQDFTGITAPYEEPTKPDIHIKTDELTVSQSVKVITDYLVEKGYL